MAPFQTYAVSLHKVSFCASQCVMYVGIAYPQSPLPFLTVPSTPAPRMTQSVIPRPHGCMMLLVQRVKAAFPSKKVGFARMRAHPLAEWTPGVGVSPQKHRLRLWRCHALRRHYRMWRCSWCLATANHVVPQHVIACLMLYVSPSKRLCHHCSIASQLREALAREHAMHALPHAP